MDKIFNKLHTYDIMGYLIPGIYTISYIILGLSLLKYSVNIFNKNILTSSIVFVTLSYIVGLFIQEIAYKIEKYELKHIFKDTYSFDILNKASTIISKNDKLTCWKILKKHFKIFIDLRTKNIHERNKKIRNYSQSCYERCRELLKYKYRNENCLNQSEIFNIHYGMSRNLLAASLLAIIYFSIITIILICVYGKFSIIGILYCCTMYACSKLMYGRTQRYARYHVKNTIMLYITTYSN